MTPKSFAALAVVTAVVTVGALYSAHERYSAARTDRSEEILFPELADRVNDVTRLTIKDAAGEIVIERRDGSWVVASRHGYPADGAKVREALFGLSQLRALEAKTQVPELYPRLEVEDVTAKDAKSRLWRLENADGMVLAEILIGKQRYDLGGTEARGIYVREAGEAQSWLARGRVPVDQDAVQWLDRNVADIRVKRVKRVTTVDAEGNELVAVKDAPTDEHFRIANLPDGFALKERWQWEVDSLGSAMSGLDLDQVAPDANFDFTDAVRAEVETFGGLIVRASLVQLGAGSEAKWWARLEAAANPDVGTPPPTPERKPEDLTGDKATDEALAAEERIRSREEVAAEVEALNKRYAGWAYRIADYKVKPLRLRLQDLKAEPATDKAS